MRAWDLIVDTNMDVLDTRWVYKKKIEVDIDISIGPLPQSVSECSENSGRPEDWAGKLGPDGELEPGQLGAPAEGAW